MHTLPSELFTIGFEKFLIKAIGYTKPKLSSQSINDRPEFRL